MSQRRLAGASRASPSPPRSATSTSRTASRFPTRVDERDRQGARTSSKKQMGQKLGDPKNPLLLSVRSGAKFSMPGMMNTILNLGLNDETDRGPGAEERQSALRLRLLSPLHPDVRRSGARNRHGEVRPHLRRAQSQDEGQARYRPDRRRSEGDHRGLQEARAEGNREAVPAGCRASS